MSNANLNTCFAFINSHTAPAGPASAKPAIPRAVTISRQAGGGGLLVANKLAERLQQQAPLPGKNWTVFDRDLIKQVLADHNLPEHLEKFLPENRISAIEDTLADIFGVRPTAEVMVQKTAETLLKFAELGGVILIGRAGNIITAHQPHVLHVRLVASLEDRVERIVRDDHKTPAEARKFCLDEDLARARYVKTYYKADVADPLGYHLTINTSRVGHDHAAELIGNALLKL